jgi:hypothetical protein
VEPDQLAWTPGHVNDLRARLAWSDRQDYFRWATSAMAAYPDDPGDVPAGLHLPQWSWDGPVR